jgi:hypothetical protein
MGTPNGIMVSTNLDFVVLNARYHARFPKDPNPISEPALLNYIFDAECDMYFASMFMSEIATTPVGSKLISDRAYLTNRCLTSPDQIWQFQEIVLSDTRSVREAINSGALSIAAAIGLLHTAKRFKHWISNIPYDANLLSEYYEEVSKESVVDKLPTKATRWVLFGTAGLAADAFIGGGVGTAVELGLGALDTFFVDKLICGWKPSQFIDDLNRAVAK